MRLAGVFIFLAAMALPLAASADTVIAVRTIRSHTILTAADVRLQENEQPGAFSSIADVVGLEARVVLYQGRAISAADVGPAAIVERNQIVTLVYVRGTLSIATDARSLGRAGVGERLRVMNLASRKTIIGTVDAAGNVIVGRRNILVSR